MQMHGEEEANEATTDPSLNRNPTNDAARNGYETRCNDMEGSGWSDDRACGSGV